VGWVTFPPILMFLGCSVLGLSANTCQTPHVTLWPSRPHLWPWRSRRWYGSSWSICVPSLNFVGLPFGRHWAFNVWALIRLVTFECQNSTTSILWVIKSIGLPFLFLAQLCKTWIDFNNSFTVVTTKFLYTNVELNLPPHLNYVAALPCKCTQWIVAYSGHLCFWVTSLNRYNNCWC